MSECEEKLPGEYMDEMMIEKMHKLEKENRVLKNRCRVNTQGLVCSFCPMDCENRAEKFRGDIK